jgi:DNA-binding transcriptional MocR family regulator
MPDPHPVTAPTQPLYRQLADRYLAAIHTGSLATDARFPSLRELMRSHEVSLSTAMQACRHLEDQGWLQARPRSGYFVQRPHRAALKPVAEPTSASEAAAYAGLHEHASRILRQGDEADVHTDLALAVGTPDFFPNAALQRTAQRVLRHDPEIFTTTLCRKGYLKLKVALARHLLTRGVNVSPDEVVVTHGCIESVNVALRAVAQPGDVVAVESPTYHGFLQVLDGLGLRALEIPTSPTQGLSVDALAFALQQGAAGVAPDSIKAVLCMPSMHNPLGCSMPDTQKQRLVALCHQHDVALIEDDVYGDMGAGTGAIRPAKAFDLHGGVIHCGSLNKVLAPNLRVGWVVPGRWHRRVEMLHYTQTRRVAQWSQVVAAEFIGSSAFTRHLHKFRNLLNQQRTRLADAVAQHFPPGTRSSLPDGGMILWVELPGQVSSEALFTRALAQGIKVAPGAIFSRNPKFAHFVRLACAQQHSRAVESAVRTLGALTQQLLLESARR